MSRSTDAARRTRAIAALQHVLESHGWLVLRDARDRSPFALIALASRRSVAPTLTWPTGRRWVGVALGTYEDGFHHSLEELRDIACAHGGEVILLSATS